MKGLPPSQQLLAFKLVTELGSFTAAAHTLNTSQSAISHQISRLERRIGFRLLTRTSQNISLTDFGERYYAAISAPLDSLLRALEKLGEPTRGKRIVIKVESGLASAWLSQRLQKFLKLCPGLHIEQHRASGLNLRDGAEIAIKWGNGHWPNYNAEKLMNIDYTPMCSPALASSEPKIRVVSDLRHHTLIHDRQYREWQLWLEFAGGKRVEARRGHVVDDTNILIDMAISSQGIALCAPQLTQRAINSGQLVMLFPDIKLRTDEAYYIVTRKDGNISEHAKMFIRWLKAEVKSDVTYSS